MGRPVHRNVDGTDVSILQRLFRDPRAGYAKGHIAFALKGEKLRGGWALIRMRGAKGGDKNWLLVKEQDAEARRGKAAAVTELLPKSVKSGRAIDELGAKGPREAVPRASRASPRAAAALRLE